jgi:hypothetical protein
VSAVPEWVAILRDPEEVASRCIEERALAPLARASLACIVVGAGALGAVLGSFRGGPQIALAAVKLPIVMLATLVLAAPAFYALANAMGRAWSFRTVVALALAATGRAGLALAALTPPLWLAMDLGLGYHASALAAVAVVALGGLLGVALVLHAFGGTVLGLASSAACGVVFLAVLAQTSWIARPYLLRPRAEAIVWVRSLEGTFLDAIVTSARSARGDYATMECHRGLGRYEMVDGTVCEGP